MAKYLYLPLSLLLLLSACTTKKEPVNVSAEPTESTPLALAKVWETDTTLTTCEAVIYDEVNDVLYVSNINRVPPTAKDNDGFISILSTSGEILNLKWVEGISAPKGMGIIGNALYVTNIDEIVEIDILKGSIVNRHPVTDAIFLNDITVQNSATLFISDMGTNKIHTMKDNMLALWTNDSTLEGPNGLLAQENKLMVASSGTGRFLEYNLMDSTRTVRTDAMMGGDGIISFGADYLVSCWIGEIYHISADNKRTLLLDTKSEKLNTADIWYIQDQNLLLVPTFFGNKVVAYQIK